MRQGWTRAMRNMCLLRPRSRAGNKRQKIKDEPGEKSRGWIEVLCHGKEYILCPEHSVGLLRVF